MDEEKQRYSIGEVSRKLGLSQRRIIEYERSGLLKTARAPRTNNRMFTDFDVQQIKMIQGLIHKHGFTLRSLLHLATNVPCWRLFRCEESGCAAYNRAEQPCWRILEMNKNGDCGGDCERCVVYLASRKTGKLKFLNRPLKNQPEYFIKTP